MIITPDNYQSDKLAVLLAFQLNISSEKAVLKTGSSEKAVLKTGSSEKAVLKTGSSEKVVFQSIVLLKALLQQIASEIVVPQINL